MYSSYNLPSPRFSKTKSPWGKKNIPHILLGGTPCSLYCQKVIKGCDLARGTISGFKLMFEKPFAKKNQNTSRHVQLREGSGSIVSPMTSPVYIFGGSPCEGWGSKAFNNKKASKKHSTINNYDLLSLLSLLDLFFVVLVVVVVVKATCDYFKP